jgi:hypothetical protein
MICDWFSCLVSLSVIGLANNTCVSPDELEKFIMSLLAAYDQGVISTPEKTSAPNWDFASAVFFTITVITTIGK